MKIRIPPDIEERAREIGGHRGGKRYRELRAYVAEQTEKPIKTWERDPANNDELYAVVDD